MNVELEPFFNRYEALVRVAEETFEKIKTQFPDCVTCKITCADCCHALFDLSLIEAIYINHRFHETFQGKQKEKRLLFANEIDRKIYKLKRTAYKSLEAGKDESEILLEMAEQRIRCPLLNDSLSCDLYDYRPITCRLYGVPTSIGGKSHTCGLTGFKKGETYPTVNIDILQKKLYELSESLVRAIGSKYTRMAEMLVPLSMALLTEYNDEYLGIEALTAEEDDALPSSKAGKQGRAKSRESQ
jgi:Fe-S-cluster containining protein